MGLRRRNQAISGLFRATPHQEMAWSNMTQQWDTTVSNDEKPTEKARAIRARQRAIGRELRRMYDDVAQEPVPDDFMDLLRQIDEAERQGREEGVVMPTSAPSAHAPRTPENARLQDPNCSAWCRSCAPLPAR